MVLSEAKITTKRQITLPIKVMKELKINPGDMIIFEQHGKHIEIIPAAKNFTIDDFIEKHSGDSKVKLSQKQLNQAKKETWGERYKK